MSESLPERPDLELLKKQARDLLHLARSGDKAALGELGEVGRGPALHDAQRRVAQRFGLSGWAQLKAAVERRNALEDPAHALFEAIQSDNAAGVKGVLSSQPDLRARLNEAIPGGAFGQTALHVAVRRKQIPVIEALIAAGADPNQRSHWWAGGFSILEECDRTLLLFLLQLGARVDALAAARHGLVGDLKRLISADPKVVEARGGDGKTPLHWASSIPVVDLLLESGADIDALDVDHESTPAQYLLSDHPAIVRHLLARGARSDLLMAASLGDVPLARRHLAASPEAIRMSVSQRWFPMTDPKAGGTIYIWTLGWHTTAHDLARRNGDEPMLSLLMAASPKTVQLARACEWGDQALLAKLGNSHGAPTLPEDRVRLVHAAQRNDARAVELLLKHGWPAESIDTDAATALHWASWHGNAAMVERLLAAKPPLEAKDSRFAMTPAGWSLHGSGHSWHRAGGDYPKVVGLLRRAGALFAPNEEQMEMLPEELVKALA